MQTSGTPQALSARQNAAVRARTRPNEIGQVTGPAGAARASPVPSGARTPGPGPPDGPAASQRPGERPHRGGPWLAASGDEGQPAGPDGEREHRAAARPKAATARLSPAGTPGGTMMHTSPPSATAVIWVSNDVTGVCLRSIITSPAAATASARGPSAGEGRQHPAMPRTPGVSRLVPRVLPALPWAGPGRSAMMPVSVSADLGCWVASLRAASSPAVRPGRPPGSSA